MRDVDDRIFCDQDFNWDCMKELEPILNSDKLEQQEIVAEQEKKKEIKLIGRQRKVRGLTLWEYNENTKVLDRAKFKQDTIRYTNDPEVMKRRVAHKKVNVNDSCVYEQALNRKNAIKQLRKRGYNEFK